MKTTKFAFLQKDQSILVIEKSGEIKSFNEPLTAQLGIYVINSDNSIEKVKQNHPGGIWTIIDSDDYNTAMLLINANIARVSKIRKIEDAKKTEENKIKAAAKAQAESAYIADLYKMPRGWYLVDFSALVSVIRGNDGFRDYSWKVLADNGYQAFELALQGFNEKMPKNVSFVYHFCEITAANIEYVGIWTDELELENPSK